jgi:hypothetical protein
MFLSVIRISTLIRCAPRSVIHDVPCTRRVYLYSGYKCIEFFPTPVGTPGGKPLRLTARGKIARARPARFWPADPFLRVSVCLCV